MRLLSVLLVALSLQAAPRVDNVLVRMVPPGVTSLVGAHMDQITISDLYRRLIADQKLPQLDDFVRDTGFDPRRDVREILIANFADGSAVLARGNFNMKQHAEPGVQLVRRGPYTIHVSQNSGYCILDKTLAVAGDLPAVQAALDEWQHGKHTAAQPLLASAASISPQTQLWGVSSGFSTFLTKNMPRVGNGIDFSAIFRGVQGTWFAASLSSGFQGFLRVNAADERDAGSLRDTAKGLVGLGRLTVPQNQPELLRFWDGLTTDMDGRMVTVNVDIPGSLVDQMVRLLSAPSGRGGRGPGTGR